MAAIVTVTASPCIDKSIVVPELIPDKKLKAGPPVTEPGGGGVNVARAICKLGGEALAVYPAGSYTGSYFNELLQKENVPADPLQTDAPTRENIILFEEKTNRQYRIGVPATELPDGTWSRLQQKIWQHKDCKILVASGSLPPGIPADAFAQLAREAKQRDILFIADTSGDALRHVLEAGVFLIKPNLGELAALTGISYIEPDQVVPAAREVVKKYHCEAIVVSMGEQGACLVTSSAAWKAKPPVVTRRSTVGAGDSMVAGITLALAEGAKWKSVLQRGVAAGTAATLNPGTALCDPADVQALIPQIELTGL